MAKKNKKTYFTVSEKQLDNIIENTSTLYDVMWGMSKDLRFNKRLVSILTFVLGALIVLNAGVFFYFKIFGI